MSYCKSSAQKYQCGGCCEVSQPCRTVIFLYALYFVIVFCFAVVSLREFFFCYIELSFAHCKHPLFFFRREYGVDISNSFYCKIIHVPENIKFLHHIASLPIPIFISISFNFSLARTLLFCTAAAVMPMEFAISFAVLS